MKPSFNLTRARFDFDFAQENKHFLSALKIEILPRDTMNHRLKRSCGGIERALLLVLAGVFAVAPAMRVEAAAASVCESGGLNLSLSIETDNGLSRSSQALELGITGTKAVLGLDAGSDARSDIRSGGTDPVVVGVATNVVRQHSEPVRLGHCRAWVKVHGSRLSQTLAALNLAAARQKKAGQPCPRRGVIAYIEGLRRGQVEVCLAVPHDPQGPMGHDLDNDKLKEFKILYESVENFLVMP